jgi:hypothetical protein
MDGLNSLVYFRELKNHCNCIWYFCQLYDKFLEKNTNGIKHVFILIFFFFISKFIGNFITDGFTDI